MCAQAAWALLLVAVIAVVACCAMAARRREGYLIYPYLDLGSPGERGSPYGLVGCA